MAESLLPIKRTITIGTLLYFDGDGDGHGGGDGTCKQAFTLYHATTSLLTAHRLCLVHAHIYVLDMSIKYRHFDPLYRPPRPCGLMDKASDFGSEDCEFESRRGRNFFSTAVCLIEETVHLQFCPCDMRTTSTVKCISSWTYNFPHFHAIVRENNSFAHPPPTLLHSLCHRGWCSPV